MKRVCIFIHLVLFFQLIHAQTIDQIKADRQAYIWGEGSGITLNRADQDALGMLINQISTQVESRFTLLQEENRNGGKETFEETFKGVINTYSTATLRNTERIVISNEPDAKIFRYTKRADVDKIFADRERKIIEFARNGQQFSEKGEVAYALRYFYWSLTLLRSHPNANTLNMIDAKGNDRLLISWIPIQINSILSNVSISITGSKNDGDLTRYTLAILYNNEPARNFDYSYWTGRDWTNIFSSKNGLGIAEFIGTDAVKEIRLKAEYVFEGETNIDNELRDVMGKLDVVPFRSSYFNVPVGIMQPPPKPLVVKQPETKTRGNLLLVTDTKPYEQAMNTLVEAIRKGNYNATRSLFTPDAFELSKNLLQYGQAQIIREPDFRFINFEDGVMCRSLAMSFKFKNNNRSFVEDVVFHFNKDKKISNISFGLGELALQDIVDKDVWDERVRLIMINFLENYKTAYALKRADYIESIFADDALIIVGSVLKTKVTGDNPYRNNRIVEYNRYTKEQFIRNLKHCFASNEFINIRFEDNIIRKSGTGGEVYGIQIKQDYFSSNYGDSGYLFLLVDMNDPNQPLIHVRTWQPEKNPDGSIYGLGDF
ncbi:MAG: hypothetical protein PHD06_11690 [Bacteroidales bacterium]|jgi:hypothetical protein|nr:hypothetical protein [Bacteroidales bacterium]MDY0197137.1 hypothetical protein [Tenuifilaceae bacterium]